MAANSEEEPASSAMEIVIRRVGMEDHINIVKLFQVIMWSNMLAPACESFFESKISHLPAW